MEIEIRLSPEAEKKIAESLAKTLREQIQIAETAFRERKWEVLKQAGHQLRGNSAAQYFQLAAVKEIGRQWEHGPWGQKEAFEMQVARLKRLIRQLERKARRYL